MAATQRDSSTGSSSTFDFPDANVTYEGQTFTPSEAYRCDEVRFYATWGHSDPGTCRVSIQETTAGLPNGSLVTDWATFSVSGAQAKTLRTVTFTTQPTLSSGTKYAIVWQAPSGESGVKELIIWGHTSSTYAAGNRVYYLGSWNDVPTQDHFFQIWGSDALVLPGKPINPTPTDEASDITLHSITGTWESGGDTDSYNVYYGTLSGFLELVEAGVTDLSLDLVEEKFSVYGKISYWRIDAVNENGTTQGDEWVFTTMTFAPPLPTGYSLDYGEDPPVLAGTPTGESNMMTVRKLIVAANDKIWYEDI